MAARKSPKATVARPVLQWATGGLGLMVTIAAIGVVVWEAVQPEDPSALSASIVEVRPTPGGHVVRVEVSNAGRETASAVQVEGRVGSETASAALDYVPGHGHAVAYLRFDGAPSAAEVRVTGWSEP